MKELDIVKSKDLNLTRATIEISGKELSRIIAALADHAEHKFPFFNAVDEDDEQDKKDFIEIRTGLEALREKMINP